MSVSLFWVIHICPYLTVLVVGSCIVGSNQKQKHIQNEDQPLAPQKNYTIQEFCKLCFDQSLKYLKCHNSLVPLWRFL